MRTMNNSMTNRTVTVGSTLHVVRAAVRAAGRT